MHYAAGPALGRGLGWQRYQHHLGALADHLQHAVAAFLAQVGDVRAGGFEDPQPE
jgi:hypothetical protein